MNAGHSNSRDHGSRGRPSGRQAGAAHGSATWWRLAGGLLLVLTGLPYVLGPALELEVVVAQPLLRIALLVLGTAMAFMALRRAGVRLAILPLLSLSVLLLEAWSTTGWAPLAEPDQDADLRVFSHNVGMAPPGPLADWLRANRIDIVLLQEVYVGNQAEYEELAVDLGYHVVFHMLSSDAGMGGLILSRLPLTPLAPVSAPTRGGGTRYFARARITYNGRPLEIYTAHLESLPMVQGQRRLFGSSTTRLYQSRLLADAIALSPHPVILGGDLNATPLYRSIGPLRRALRDAWEEAGWGLGNTYPAAFPLTRIDAVLQRGFHVRYARVERVTGSDHRGLMVMLDLAGEQSSDR
jgi:vancomycin resistance protein VanJ